MPFIRESYFIPTPIKATQFLIRTLGYSQRQAQKVIDKARLRTPSNLPIAKSDIISGNVWLTHFVDSFYSQEELITPFFCMPDFVLFDKPAKLLTHPKGSFLHKTLMDSVRFFCGGAAQPIHRLDYETSGLILVATHYGSEIALKQQLSARNIQKTYLARVSGLLHTSCLVDAPILSPHKSEKPHKNLSVRSRIDSLGKPAQTLITPLGFDKDSATTYISVQPLTGRTHQIRLHCAHIGYPICNDFLYGVTDDVAAHYLDFVRKKFYDASLQESRFLQDSSRSDIKESIVEILESSEVFAQDTYAASTIDSDSTSLPDYTSELCLHAYHLRFCYEECTYSLFAPLPKWWDTSISPPNSTIEPDKL